VVGSSLSMQSWLSRDLSSKTVTFPFEVAKCSLCPAFTLETVQKCKIIRLQQMQLFSRNLSFGNIILAVGI
jgi:hypothetical protein